MSDTEEPPQGRTSVGARRSPETETAVLDAAEALIAEAGFARLTMEAVAKRARAGKATLYRWWPSRAHLLLAVYSRSKDTLPEPDTGALREDLAAYLAAMIRHWRDTVAGQTFRHLIAEAQGDPQALAALRREHRERWHHIHRIVLRARDRGEVAGTVQAAEQRIAALMWYLLLTDQLPPPEAAGALADQLVGPI
jgi:AcrR family transcriptional regulator